jgi:hypothetical protein
MAYDNAKGFQLIGNSYNYDIFDMTVNDSDEVWDGDLLQPSPTLGEVDRYLHGGTNGTADDPCVGIAMAHVLQDSTGTKVVPVCIDINARFRIQVSDAGTAIAATDQWARFHPAYSGDPDGDFSNMELATTIDNTNGQVWLLGIISGPEPGGGLKPDFGADLATAIVKLAPGALYWS